MPSELIANSVRFPVTYAPWYVYTATLDASPTAFEYGDMLVPDAAGTWDKNGADEADLSLGYAFALENFAVGDTTVDVAVPGSAVPLLAEASIRPTSLVSFDGSTDPQRVTVGSATLLAAGKVLGRLRNHHADHNNLRLTVLNDIVVILTGAI
jgi:hypothetical protein